MATYYWVGGSGNWDATTTTNWATSSGGAGSAGVPTSADDVIFDANSNTSTTAFTVTVTGTANAASNCANFSTGGAGGALDGAMTLSLGATAYIDVYGSLTLPAANFTWSGTTGSYIRLRGTGSYTITTNGVSLTSTNIASLAQGTWTLGSAFTNTASIDWQQGTFNTSNFAVSTNQLLFQVAGTRTFNAGSSTITCTSITPFTYSGSNLTFNAGTSQINCSNTLSTFAGGGLTFYNVSFTSTALYSISISGSNTFNNLTFAARAAAGVAILTFSPTTTNTINGTLTLGSGTTGVARLIVRTATTGTAATLYVATLTAITDIDFKDITASGAASPFSGTRIGDAGGNTNITGATPRTVYWNSAASANWNAAVWSTSSGNTGGTTTAFPLAQDTIIIDNAGLTTGNTITIQSGANYYIGTLDLSTRSNAANLAIAAANSFVGDYTLSSAITVSGTGTLSFVKGSGTQTITSANVTFTQNIQIFTPATIPVRINGNLTLSSTSTFTLTTGTLDLTNGGAGNYTLSVGLFSSNNSNTRVIAFGTGQITLTGTNNTLWNTATSTGFSYTGTPKIVSNYSGSVGTRAFTLGTTSAFTVGAGTGNQLSFGTAGTDTVLPNGTMASLDFTGFTGTFAPATNSLTFTTGNLTLVSGMTFTTGTGFWTFTATSGTQVITSAGKTLYSITQSGVGGTVQLADALTSTGTYTLTNGTLDLNNQTLTAGIFSSSNSNTRAIAFGAAGTGNITITGNNNTVWSTSTSTNLTMSGTPIVNLTYSGSTGTRTIINAVNVPHANFNISAGSDIVTFSSSFYGNNVDFTGFSGTWNATTSQYFTGNLKLSSGMTMGTLAGTINLAATLGAGQITSNGKTFPCAITQTGPVKLVDALISTGTYTLTSSTLDLNNNTLTCSILSTNNSNTRVIAFGTGNITITGTNASILFGGTLTGFSLSGTPTINVTGAGLSGETRTFVWGSAAAGTESTAVSINVSAGADLITNNAASVFLNYTFSGTFSGSWSTTLKNIYGNLTLKSGMTIDATTAGNLRFSSSSSTVRTVTTAGISFAGFGNLVFGIDASAQPTYGSWQLQDALTHSGQINLSTGTLDLNNKTMTIQSFLSNNSNTRQLNLGSSTIYLTGTGTVWGTGTTTGMTLIPGTSSIILTDTSTTARTFNPGQGSLTYNNVIIGGTTGTSTLSIGNNGWTINKLSSTKTVAHTISFASGTSSEYRYVRNFDIRGSSGNIVTLNTTADTYTTSYLVKLGGGVVDSDYLNVSDVIALDESLNEGKWYAGPASHSTLTNTSGWILNAAPKSFFDIF